MVLYSMHLRDGTEKLVNSGALEFPSLEALRDAVLIKARDLLSRDAGNGTLDFRFRIDAEDEYGAIVYSIQLEQAQERLRPSEVKTVKSNIVRRGHLTRATRKRLSYSTIS
jgi:hypothetical protein